MNQRLFFSLNLCPSALQTYIGSYSNPLSNHVFFVVLAVFSFLLHWTSWAHSLFCYLIILVLIKASWFCKQENWSKLQSWDVKIWSICYSIKVNYHYIQVVTSLSLVAEHCLFLTLPSPPSTRVASTAGFQSVLSCNWRWLRMKNVGKQKVSK